ncbi:unnamed protein product [Kuraishia capsulata CBS 1993]|uniref:Late embryogenesis abundant protein LEA-2 subgroup domain-containing protein n=1 Tax=Kuraishia capsulata CBS 1993 TaxID=1382522 RepID=W6MX15_9ASCO|nr:uncharacterized protein KUCA_T00004086001 [Kuraishia capsulata CBS 1993]CDK28105.1 unnamed protein product [Kuraishia capsulata CBS 1993]
MLRAVPPIPMTDEEITAGTATGAGSETDPLLGSAGGEDNYGRTQSYGSRLRGKWHILVLVLFVVIILGGINVYLISSYIEDMYLDAAMFDVEKLEVVEITNNGARVNFKGSLSFDYNQIHGLYYKTVGVSLGWLLGSITSIPSEKSCFMYAGLVGSNKHHVSKIRLPPIEFSLRQSEISHLDLDIMVEVIPLEVSVLVSAMMERASQGAKGLDLNVDLLGESRIKAGWLYDSSRLALSRRISLPLNMENLVSVSEVTVSELEGGFKYKVDAEALIKKTIFPVRMDVGTLYWDISLPGCETVDKVGRLTTHSFVVEPYSDVSLRLSSTVGKVSKDLTKICSNGSSPLSSLVNDFQNGNTVKVFLSGAKIQDPDIPKWLSELVTTLFVPIGVDSSMVNVGLEKPEVQSIGLSSVGMKFEKGVPIVSVSLVAGVEMPPQLQGIKHVNVTQIRGSIQLSTREDLLATLDIDDWQSSSLKFDNEVRMLNVSTDIKETELFLNDTFVVSELLQNVISGDPVKFDVNMTADAVVDMPLLHTEFNCVNFVQSLVLPALPVGEALDDLKVKIDQVYLVESTKTSAVLLMDLELANLFGLDFTIGDHIIDMNLEFNGTKVGHISTEGIVLASEGLSNVTTWLHLDTAAAKQGCIKTEELVSEYLSGSRPAITVVGHSGSFIDSPSLSQSVDGVGIDIRLPEFVYEPEEKISTVDSNESKDITIQDEPSGFIISSTMHIMTSEIEFTVFNPIVNSEVFINILEARAMYEGTTLGYINKEQRLLIPPGLYKTPRIPITYAGGIGGSILRKALNGNLKVEATAIFKFKLDKFRLDLMYHGSGLSTNIRL